MKKIPLTHGKFAKVSNIDFPRLSKFKWILSKPPKKYPGEGYAVRCTFGRKGKKIFMHKEIRIVPSGVEVDHRDRDRLNNMRSNLRVATRQQNSSNLKKKKNNTSGFVGVSRPTGRKKWTAMIQPHGRAIYLGTFLSKKEAAHAYNKAAKKFFGKFSRLNKI